MLQCKEKNHSFKPSINKGNFYGNSEILLAMFKTDMKISKHCSNFKNTGHAGCALTLNSTYVLGQQSPGILVIFGWVCEPSRTNTTLTQRTTFLRDSGEMPFFRKYTANCKRTMPARVRRQQKRNVPGSSSGSLASYRAGLGEDSPRTIS